MIWTTKIWVWKLGCQEEEVEWEETNLAETCRSRMQVELCKKGG
jgi:hypothetical protein